MSGRQHLHPPALLAAIVVSAAAPATAATTGLSRCLEHAQRGELADAHDALAEAGIEFGFGFTGAWQANHLGGTRRRPRGRFTGSWDIETRLDTAKLGLWQGGAFFVHLEGSEGAGIDGPFVGSLFGTNADADSTGGRRLQFSEYWYEHTLADGLVTFRIGKMDATADFDNNAFANDECHQFLNGALVNNPTIPFPDYALGAQLFVRPPGRFYFAVGAWDANANGWQSGRDTLLGGRHDLFVACEAGVETSLPGPNGAALPGTYRVGAWYDGRRYEVVGDGDRETGAAGLYLSLDQMVYKESPDEDDSQGLGLFARLGRAPERFSEVEWFWSLGCQYQGLVPGRDDDLLGFGLASGRLGSPARDGARHAAETVCECYYRLMLREGVEVTADIQYVRHPGADAASCLVPGLRVHVEF